ncbi:MAG: hypothetical protein EBS56_13380 [Planctomycetia bacterium]|nr:hypothetical protein [Planctomycetia bacterium]
MHRLNAIGEPAALEPGEQFHDLGRIVRHLERDRLDEPLRAQGDLEVAARLGGGEQRVERRGTQRPQRGRRRFTPVVVVVTERGDQRRQLVR